ncbi:hypothetical protein [Vallitalea guaymasensis]|uniref:hypothetical protein n=1 Tax=Vallitalea guaymasensis TaxID=1185412 RepID=UPI000DE2E9FD|nr:hypothetical protein [Vallitalea guaymasensis]
MKDKIFKIYNSYINADPTLKNKTVMLMIEGLGNYAGEQAKKSNNLHPKGRMGAVFAIITKNEELFYTSYASTLPDIPMGDAKYNSGSQTPTLCKGIYKAYSKLHRGYPAMELGLHRECVPVIRNTGVSVSSGINIHQRPLNDYSNAATSAGCLTILGSKINRMLVKLNVISNNGFIGEGHYIGRLIVDRSCIPQELQQLYKKVYGQYYSKVFNTNAKIEVDNIPKWQLDGFNEVVEKGIIDTPDYWKNRLDKPLTVGEFFAIYNKCV